MLAGHQCGPKRRTNRRVDHVVRQVHPLLGQLIQIGRHCFGIAIVANAAGTELIGSENNDIRFIGRTYNERRKTKQQSNAEFHERHDEDFFLSRRMNAEVIDCK